MTTPTNEQPPLEIVENAETDEIAAGETDEYLAEPEVEDIPAWEQIVSAISTSPPLGLLVLALTFALGLWVGYLLWGYSLAEPATTAAPAEAVVQVNTPSPEPLPTNLLNLPDSYALPVSYKDIGPQLLAAGTIDYDRFAQVYREAGQPLTQEQQNILRKGSDVPIVINHENAYFLLNYFWALGLTNQNIVLTEGPMVQNGNGDIERFASTGGWTLATKSIKDIYASTPIISLTSEQQARLEEVAYGVYRPCCNNPTAFPDCNHGMAMLGLLELMASQDASVDEMFEAAKYVNAFWFPQQTTEIALVFKHAKGQDFVKTDPREFVGPNFSSAGGFQAVHQWLNENNLLEQVPNSGNSCGV